MWLEEFNFKKKKMTFGNTDSATSSSLACRWATVPVVRSPFTKQTSAASSVSQDTLLWKLSTPTTIPATLERVILPPPAISLQSSSQQGCSVVRQTPVFLFHLVKHYALAYLIRVRRPYSVEHFISSCTTTTDVLFTTSSSSGEVKFKYLKSSLEITKVNFPSAKE